MLVDLFRLSDPRTVPGGDTLRIGDVLRVAEGKIDLVEDQPEIQARLWEAMASIHGSRSELRPQSAALQRGIGAAHRAGAFDLEMHLRCQYAVILERMQGVNPAYALLRQTLAECEGRYGPEDLRVAEVLRYYAAIWGPTEHARSLLERSLAIRRLLQPGDSQETAYVLHALAGNWRDRGRFDRAFQVYDEERRMLERLYPPDHPDLLQVRHALALAECMRGEFALALRMEQDLLPLRRRVLGPNTIETAGSLHVIGLALANLGQPAAAADSLERARDMLLGITGRAGKSAHIIEVAMTMALARAGRPAEARAHLDHLVAEADTARPAAVADVWALRMQFAGFEQAAGHAPDLESMRRSLARVRRARAMAPRVLLDAVVEIASASLAAGGHAASAESLFTEASAIADTALSPRHPLRACLDAGLLASRAASARPYDRAALRASWEQCRSWGCLPATLTAPIERTLASR